MITRHKSKRSIPKGLYTPVVEHAGVLYVSGQGTFQSESGEKYVGDDIEKQTTIALTNLKTTLEDAGSSLDRVLKINIYTTALERISEINKVYETFFAGHLPARTALGVAQLPGGMLIEIEAIAATE